jgi:hypothetical protein
MDGKSAQAAASLEQGVRVEPAHATTHVFLAAAYAELGQREKVAAELAALDKLNPRWLVEFRAQPDLHDERRAALEKLAPFSTAVNAELNAERSTRAENESAKATPPVSITAQDGNVVVTQNGTKLVMDRMEIYPAKAAALQSRTVADEDLILAKQPPVVVETFPESGARDVEPGEKEIRVRFSKPMSDGSWSWSNAWSNSLPEFGGEPHYEADARTCVLKANLEAGRAYAFWLNSEKFQNFKDKSGQAAIPYLLIFQTKQK